MKIKLGIWTGLVMLWVAGCGEEVSVEPVETESMNEDTSSPQQIEATESDASEEAATGLVVINEIVAKASDDGADWVELYNPSETVVDLGAFRIEDEDEENVYLIPEGVVLEPGEFLVVEGKNSEEDLAFSFGLGAGDQVKVYDNNGALVDEVSWSNGDAPVGRSLGRYPDGGEDWGMLEEPTYEGPNAPFAEEQPQPEGHPTDAFFQWDEVLEVSIEMPVEDWEELRSQTRTLLDLLEGDCLSSPPADIFSWFSATVTVNGETLPNVGVRKKGFFGSLSDVKPSLKVRFDRFEEGQLLGGVMKRMTLNNGNQDPSKLNACMTYTVFAQAGMPAPRCSFARVEVNGENYGVFVHVDSIKTTFLEQHFEDTDGNLYEGTLSEFQEGWYGTMEKKSNEEDDDWSDIAGLSAALEPTNPDWDAVAKWVDLDAFLTHWAMEALVNHWDGYAGNRNNYYLYRDLDGPFTFIPWGADATFFEFEEEQAEEPVIPGVMINGLLANRMYASGEWRTKYRERLLELMDIAWDEAYLQDQLESWAEIVQAVAHPLEREPAEEDTQRLRDFISTRRDTILAGFGESAPDASVEVEQTLPCWEELGAVALTFTGDWGTQESDVPLEEGDLSVSTYDYQGASLPVANAGTTVGWGEVSEGPDAYWSLLLWIADETGGVDLLAFNLVPWMMQTGVEWSLDNWFPYGVRYRLDPPFYQPIPLDQIRGGFLKFSTIETGEGGQVKGELNARIFSFD